MAKPSVEEMRRQMLMGDYLELRTLELRGRDQRLDAWVLCSNGAAKPS
jgi:hypothetical protein